MRNFQDMFETRKQSFIFSVFSIGMTVPLKLTKETVQQEAKYVQS